MMNFFVYLPKYLILILTYVGFCGFLYLFKYYFGIKIVKFILLLLFFCQICAS